MYTNQEHVDMYQQYQQMCLSTKAGDYYGQLLVYIDNKKSRYAMEGLWRRGGIAPTHS
jgi:hypothetical protein